MSRKTPRILAAVIAGLVLVLLVLRTGDRDDAGVPARFLPPDFSAHANDIDEIRIAGAAEDAAVTLHRADGQWRVAERDGYAADIGKLRKLIVALAESRIVEEKTSDPERYAKLGVDDPATGGDGTAIDIGGPGFSYSIIVGDRAQGDFRYVRLAGQAASFLVDRNPEVPATASGWLLPGIVDVGADEVSKVTINHADGETLVIEKASPDLTDFTVTDIPEGREPSYASVGNGIAAALGSLSLDDVRKAVDSPALATAVFETWDGLEIEATVVAGEDDTHWVSFETSAGAPRTDGEEGEAQAGDEAAAEAARLNARLAGWQFRLPAYKQNLLLRRWEDVLKPDDGG